MSPPIPPIIPPIIVPAGPSIDPTAASNPPSAILPIAINAALPGGSPKTNTSSKNAIISPMKGTIPTDSETNLRIGFKNLPIPKSDKSFPKPFLPFPKKVSGFTFTFLVFTSGFI